MILRGVIVPTGDIVVFRGYIVTQSFKLVQINLLDAATCDLILKCHVLIGWKQVGQPITVRQHHTRDTLPAIFDRRQDCQISFQKFALIMLRTACLLVAIAAAYASDVVELGDSDFESRLAGFDIALVKFYAPWWVTGIFYLYLWKSFMHCWQLYSSIQ